MTADGIERAASADEEGSGPGSGGSAAEERGGARDGGGDGRAPAAESPGVAEAVAALEEDPDEEGADEATPQPVFKNVEEFVRYRFVPVYIRPEGGQFRWCKEWWRHPEAVSRFQALWHAWEVLRWEPGTGMAVWYRDHLDFQLNILLGDTGPFRECTSRRHQAPRPLPVEPAPQGWFEDEW
ncbi:DUF4913 domain-containing protein [Streptomonospora litoralis]|uniref:DUF4913 domain-containing protein n=1 Tax=Streptomonospora litoralis TaxID=2498135 RepID=A0A4P6QAA2_9ACTN|nr:DUF4913 domain-containing protein [Streptomonospora litoralis]QBI56334.1 hypothetical protein EKD16_22905 [Streptomonospora litoralis]